MPVEVGGDGMVRIERNETEVFRPESLASINGKPVVNDHPPEDVTPDNWRDHAIGVCLNPRRGEGADDRFVVGELLITAKDAIADIQAGKREISLGYDASYQQIDAGLGLQRNIIVNHVALVDKGRCGPACAIGDSAVNESTKVFDRLAKALGFKDAATMASKVKDDEGEGFGMGGRSDSLGSTTINITGAGTIAKTPDEEGEKSELSERVEKMEDAFKDLAKTVRDALKVRDAEGDPDDDDTKTDDDESEEEEGKSERTGDALFADLRAKLAIVAPGVTMPTLDAKADKAKTADRICKCKRRALDVAYATDKGKAAIAPFLEGKTKDFDRLKASTIDMVFDGAAALMKQANNGPLLSPFLTSTRTGDDDKPHPTSIAAVSAGHKAFWATRS